MEEEKIQISNDLLISKIILIRDERVLLDRDLALLYGVKPIRLREQVKRNLNRFPVHFMFQLSDKEVDILVSQNAIPSRKHLGGHLPYAFTEHGVLMLANVLKSELAIEVSIRLIELFVKLRRLYLTNAEILLEMENIKKRLNNQEKNIELVFSYFDEMLQKQSKNKLIRKIGYKIPK